MNRPLAVAAVAFLSSPAFAAADLAVSLAAPAGTHVYESGHYAVLVQNTGNHNAAAVSLTIELPRTNTSPGAAILGDLGTFDSRCAVTGTNLVCALGTVARRKSTSVGFDIALPYSSAPIVIEASAATSTGETTLANNGALHTATLLTYAVTVAAPATGTHDHCTGTNLTSYFECELFPSSISSFDAVYNANGTMDFGPDYPGITGTWTRATADRLQFVILENGLVLGTFNGRGVSSSCFEGPTVFPEGEYVAIYQVCLR